MHEQRLAVRAGDPDTEHVRRPRSRCGGDLEIRDCSGKPPGEVVPQRPDPGRLRRLLPLGQADGHAQPYRTRDVLGAGP